MTLLLGYLLLALVIAAVLFYAVVALLPTGLSVRPERDNRPFELPRDRRMRAEDLDGVRIPVSLRGYRFAETDDLIDRLAAEIVVRDEEIARLQQGLGSSSFERPDAATSEPPSSFERPDAAPFERPPPSFERPRPRPDAAADRIGSEPAGPGPGEAG